MNGRGYDYNLGRFLSVDPVIQSPGNSQSLNPYSYIMNNPLAGTDPSGYMGCAASKIESVPAGTDANHGGSASPASSLVTSVHSGAGKGNGAQQNQPQKQVNQQNSAVDTGSQKDAAAAQGGNSNTNWNEKNDSQPLVESWVFESPLSQAQTWIFDNFINPIPDIEASINAAMDGDYSGALESMAGIVGKKVQGVGKIGESIADGVTNLTERVRHFTNNKGLEGIRESGIVKASDQNSVFTERARGTPGSPRDVEQRLGIGPGRGRNYVEFDASPSEFKVIKNPITGATERVFNGNVDLTGRNATFIKR